MKTYRQKEAMKRTLLALAGTILFHCFLGGIVFWIENRRTDLELYSGPVRVTLGVPNGADGPRAEQPLEQEPPAETVQTPEKVEQTKPVETTSNPPREVEAITENLSSQSTQNNQRAETPRADDVVVPVKGETYGNTHELYLESAGGQAGRNLWIPIYLYMPLPRTLEVSILDQAVGDPGLGISPEDDKRVINRYYKRSGVELHLKEDIVSISERPDVWIVLERMGYNLDMAEYKMSRILREVEIRFTVSPAEKINGSGKVNLTASEVYKSSGYEDIDQAVLYGFRQSAYYNDSDRDLKGRFVYRFR